MASIDALRAAIDQTDHRMLELLAERYRLVGAIAEAKRTEGRAIRDLERERRVLEDRGARADALSLPRALVESMFRLVLLGSRDHQARLRAGVPADLVARRVAVVGGLGGMGRLMAQLFAELGHDVRVADVATDLTAIAAAGWADVTIVSVPIDVTEAVIREIGPYARPDGLIMDVTSVKEAPVAAMLASSRASVVGTHPMFGPTIQTLSGQRVVVCTARGETWAAWVRQMFRARGLVVTDATAEDHDRVMAVVQVLNHYQKQVLGLALARSGVPFADTLRFTSPAYLLEAYVTARHFAQSADLYGPIEMLNRGTPAVVQAFRAAAESLERILAQRDRQAFRAVFAEVRAFFGEFSDEALLQSKSIIDRVVELTAGREPLDER